MLATVATQIQPKRRSIGHQTRAIKCTGASHNSIRSRNTHNIKLIRITIMEQREKKIISFPQNHSQAVIPMYEMLRYEADLGMKSSGKPFLKAA